MPDHLTTDVRHHLDLLGDADPGVRLQAVLALGQGRHEPAAADLVERFGQERDFQVREALTWATLRIADTALPLVRATLADARWLSRLQATHTLSKRRERVDTARLLPVVDDPVDAVAARAWGAVATCGDPVAVPALVGQLARGTAETRTSLLAALVAFDDEAVPALVAALRHGATNEVRRHAADVLAWAGSPTADPAEEALVAALASPDEPIRLAALNALGQLRTESAWDAVADRSAAVGRTGVLARRLVQRRPARRALAAHRVRTDPRVDDPELAGLAGPVGRAWPGPDLSLVILDGGPLADHLAPMLAVQVAVARPRHLSRADVPPGVLASVAAEAERAAIAAGRTAAAARRIGAGAAEQWVHEHVLLEQVAVADPGRVVSDLLFGTGVRVLDFDGLR